MGRDGRLPRGLRGPQRDGVQGRFRPLRSQRCGLAMYDSSFYTLLKGNEMIYMVTDDAITVSPRELGRTWALLRCYVFRCSVGLTALGHVLSCISHPGVAGEIIQ